MIQECEKYNSLIRIYSFFYKNIIQYVTLNNNKDTVGILNFSIVGK